MTPSSIASFSFFCLLVLLLPPQHGAFSSHTSYKLGSRQFFFKTPGRSSGNSQQASTVPPATTCTSSSIETGLGSNKLPLVHRQSPCSPLHGLPSLMPADVLRRDASLLRRRFSSQSSLVASSAPSPATTIIPTKSTWDWVWPGALDYTVLVSYGMPKQQLPMFLGTNSFGMSSIRCKPCASASDDCDPVFDPSRSSTFTHILCGSPECPTNCSDGSFCALRNNKGTFAKDMLTLAPTMTIHDFRFFCHDHLHEPSEGLLAAGFLDFSRSRNSLPSQLRSSSIAPAANFSYCLPWSPRSQGFLSLGGDDATVRGDNKDIVYAPLVSNDDPEPARFYFIDLVGISLGDEDLPIPVGIFDGNASTCLNVGTTFTMLAPDMYKLLRDSFRKHMSRYSRSVPGFDNFDTCFNFTGLNELTIPLVQLKFSNGDSLVIDGHQMLYYHDPDAGPFTMACLAFSSLDQDGHVFSAVLGTYQLASMEVLYDVAGGKVGFIPGSC